MAGPSDGRPALPTSEFGRLVRPLLEMARPSDAVTRIGRKAVAFASLRAAGVALPETWVIDSSHFDALIQRVLPRKHDLRSLTKLAGTPEGDEHCARAVDDLLNAALPDDLVREVHAWWQGFRGRRSAGFAVRSSVVAAGDRSGDCGRYLHTSLVEDTADGVLSGIRRVWASAATSLAVARYGECGVRGVSVAILLQPMVPCDQTIWLASMTPDKRGDAAASLYLGVASDDSAHGARAGLVFAPARLADEAECPAVLRPLYASLPASALEELRRIAEVSMGILGADALVGVAFSARPDPTFTLLHADEGARWRTRDDETDSAWIEVLGGRVERSSRGSLSQAILVRSVERATLAGLHAVGASANEPRQFVWSSGRRTYLGLHALGAAVRDLPGLTARDMFVATGTANADMLQELVRRSGGSRRRLRGVVRAVTLVARQVQLQREYEEAERALKHSVRAMEELELTLLPTDGIATTLAGIDDLLGRTVELWSRVAASQLCYQVALRALLQRAAGGANESTAAVIVSGGGETLGAALTLALARVVDVFRADKGALEILAGAPRALGEFSDGAARGALGQFLSTYGEVVSSPFDLERPRWSEDPREVFVMLGGWLEVGGSARTAVEVAQERVRALADAELARHEPDLGWAERSALRSVVEHARKAARVRATLDKLVYRVLALFRAAVADADRRLRRIDPASSEGGAFACSFDRLVASFRTGRPELQAVVEMHAFENAIEASELAPPLSFFGFPPRACLPRSFQTPLRGIGVSSGVVDGIVVGGGPLFRTERPRPKSVLVTRSLDVARMPSYFIAGAVVSESGGMLSPAADALRELGIPAVLSVADATTFLAQGEHVRVDGERGFVGRVEKSGGA